MGNIKGILIMLVCTFFTAFGQYFLKLGVRSILNLSLIIGLFLYGIGAILLILALKHGNLNSTYPLISLSIVWVSVLSFFLLGEKISAQRLFGTGVLLFGVVCITKGGSK